jgi:conjugation transfer TcpE-like protein
MELPIYTSVFHLERRLYHIYDLELPVPLSLGQIVTFLVGLGVMVLMSRLIGPSLRAGDAWIFVLPPGLAAWASSRPLIEGKRPQRWVLSQARFFFEPRQLHGMRRPSPLR